MTIERIYTEKEISSILRRTGELHTETGKEETSYLNERQTDSDHAGTGKR